MISLELLQTPNLPEVPAEVEIVADFGEISIVVEDNVSHGFVRGNHLVVRAYENVIRDWLGQVDGFWLGSGVPAMQQFEIAHIKGNDDETETTDDAG